MKIFEQIILLPYLLITYEIFAEEVPNAASESHQSQLKLLEKEKNELYKQLNDAIEESVKNLEVSQDKDAKEGIKYALYLKERLKELNTTFEDANVKYGIEDDSDMNKKPSRRKSKFSEKLSKEFIDKLFRDQDKSEKKKKLFLNREAMQKRVEDWIAAKLAEKQKIANYKQQKRLSFAKPERCPRKGIKKKKKKGKGRKWSGRRPCCRKCCKSSYLGCLKK